MRKSVIATSGRYRESEYAPNAISNTMLHTTIFQRTELSFHIEVRLHSIRKHTSSVPSKPRP